MAFDPDAYLQESEGEQGFNPDAYLADKQGGFDPDAYLSSEEPSAGDIVKGLGVEVGAGISGSLAGGIIGGTIGSAVPGVGTAAGAVVGSMIGGATASFFGSLFAQDIEGQEEKSMGRAIAAAAIGAVPGGVGKGAQGGLTVGKVIAREGAKGAAFGATEATARAVVDEGRLPTAEELAKYGGAGALFGGALGGVTSKVGQKFVGKTPQEIDKAIARGEIDYSDMTFLAKGIPDPKKAPPQIPETRGGNVQFHGTSGNISKTGIISDTYSSDNIYGQGFYTTDAMDIARGYTKKGLGENAVIYKITEKLPVKFLDLDSVGAKQLAQDADVMGMPEVLDALDDLPANATGTDLYDWIRRNVDLPKDEIQEVFQSIQEGIARKGFGGISHVGGKLTGQKPHRVKIYFDPKNQIDVEESMRFDVPELEQLKRAQTRWRKARADLPYANKEAELEWRRQGQRIQDRINELNKPKPTMEGIVRRSMEETIQRARSEAAAEAVTQPTKNLGVMGKVLASVAPSKFVGTKAQQATIDFQRVIKAADEVSARVGRKVRRAIKKNPTLEEPLNKFLDTGEISEEVFDVLGADLQKYDEARIALQKEAIQLIDDGAYKSMDKKSRDLLREKIQNQVDGNDVYSRKEYEAFTNKNFKVDLKKRKAARQELIASYAKDGGNFDAAVKKAEKHLSRLDDGFASSKAEDPGKFYGAAVDSIFKKRSKPGPALREYLGEIKDPVERMRGTLTGIAKSVARERTNVILRKELLNAGVASETESAEGMIKLALRGWDKKTTELYGFPQVQTALNELYVGNASEKMDNIFLNGLQDLYRASVGLSKGVKVLLNTVAYPVQAYGNAANLLGMGINPFNKAARGLRLALADVPLISRALEGLENTPQSRRAILDELEDMARYGIKSANVLESDIRATLDAGPFSKLLQKGLDPVGKAYQVPDTLGRYVGWKANQNTLRKMFPNASEEVIKRQAASMINDTYQNYDKLSNVVRTLSRWGVMPQFASFTAEFMRNQYNQAKMIARMMKGTFGSEFAELGAANVTRMRAEGTKRLASLLGVYGGTLAAIEGVKAASGVDKKTEEDLRDLVYAPWDKDRSQLVKLDEDGKSGWVANPSYVVPHALGLSALKAGLRGDDEQSLVGLLMDEMVGEGSFVFQEAYRALANQDERGKKISKQLDDLKNAQERMGYFVQEAFKPGFTRELKKFRDAKMGSGDLTLREVGARQLGARINPFNVREAARFTVRNTNELAKEASSEYTSTLKYGKPTPQELERAYATANQIHQDAFAALRRNYESMQNPKFGFTEDEIIQTFKDGGLSSKRILEVMTNTPTDLPRTTKKSTSELYNEMGETMSEKRKNIQQLMSSDRELGKRLMDTWTRERKDKARGLSQRDILIRNMGVDDRVDFLSKNPGMIDEFRKKGVLSDSVIRALRIKGVM